MEEKERYELEFEDSGFKNYVLDTEKDIKKILKKIKNRSW